MQEEDEPLEYMQTNFPNSDSEDAAGLRIGPSENQRSSPFPMPEEEEEEEFVLD